MQNNLTPWEEGKPSPGVPGTQDPSETEARPGQQSILLFPITKIVSAKEQAMAVYHWEVTYLHRISFIVFVKFRFSSSFTC